MPALPYERVKKFYDTLMEYKNEDGYCVCSVSYVSKKAGINYAVGLLLPDRLEEMGIVRVYRTLLEPIESESPHFQVAGGQRYTLIKITEKPFTKELYVNYFYETTTTVTTKQRRNRKAK
jgi:hypothetical protein